jgi:hypothetical protein
VGRRLTTGAALLALAGVAGAQNIGPSTATEPYLVPSPGMEAAVKTTSILTSGDSIGGYKLVGVPDGLGAFAEDGTFILLVNHELGARAGAVRGHGATGAFVSRWQIQRDDLRVSMGEDFSQRPGDVYTWDRTTMRYKRGTAAWDHFCSADLAGQGAYRYRGYGTSDRIFLNGEETRPPFASRHGRAYAHIATGTQRGEAWQLPRLGEAAWENVVASPHPQMKTILMLLDDSSVSTRGTTLCDFAGQIGCNVPSELYMYVGTKQSAGNAIERAGLANGNLFGVRVRVDGKFVTEESNAYGFGTSGFVGTGRFSVHGFGNVAGIDGVQLQKDSVAAGVTRFQRIEDGVWDPRRRHRNDFYFVTTASFSRNSRLYRLRFEDVEQPEAGGSIEILLKGDEGQKMLDNVTMDRYGRIVMQEDVGSNDRLGRIWVYDTASGGLIEVARHNPKFFAPGGSDFLTSDEESSGIIDASRILGHGWFLAAVQAHVPFRGDASIVEHGQLLAIYIDPRIGGATMDVDEERANPEAAPGPGRQ